MRNEQRPGSSLKLQRSRVGRGLLLTAAFSASTGLGLMGLDKNQPIGGDFELKARGGVLVDFSSVDSTTTTEAPRLVRAALVNSMKLYYLQGDLNKLQNSVYPLSQNEIKKLEERGLNPSEVTIIGNRRISAPLTDPVSARRNPQGLEDYFIVLTPDEKGRTIITPAINTRPPSKSTA